MRHDVCMYDRQGKIEGMKEEKHEKGEAMD